MMGTAGNLTARSAGGSGGSGRAPRQPLSARGGQATHLKVGSDGITCFDIHTPRSLL